MANSGRVDRLTPKQRKFVEAYLGPANGNATAAARMAGYKGSEATLASVGWEILRKPEIAALVKQRMRDTLAKFSADQVLKGLAAIARNDALDSRGRKLERTADRLRALELLGRYYGLWTDERRDTAPPHVPAVTKALAQLPPEVLRSMAMAFLAPGDEAVSAPGHGFH